MTTNNTDEQMLTPGQLAKRWSLTPRTLKGMRLDNIGPKYVTVTAGARTVRYKLSDVIAYEQANTHGGSDAQGAN